MKSIITGLQAAAYPGGCVTPTPPGARLPEASPASLAADRGSLTHEGPMAHAFAPVAGLRDARKQNNSMTLIAAAGGESGPHPKWDPV